MTKLNIYEARANLSSLLRRVSLGEDIIIAKAGEPVARIVPVVKEIKKRIPVTAKGRVVIKDSFFEPLPDDSKIYGRGRDKKMPILRCRRLQDEE